MTSPSAASKSGDGALRHDLEPLAKRYPQFLTATSVTWMSGTMGTSDIGPSTYWIDAVIVLPEEDFASLMALAGLSEVAAPSVVDGMVSHLPPGPFVGGASLDADVSANGYGASAVLDVANRTVVLTALFE